MEFIIKVMAQSWWLIKTPLPSTQMSASLLCFVLALYPEVTEEVEG